jgi:type IV pilus assembly protein PilB
MSDRPTIGDILMGSGRVTEEDVARALTYQRENGGYFGEALVACGLITEEEVEWGLASQYDLPYVYPEADAVDYGAASLVAPGWALSHLTLPIMRTPERLTVIIDSPLKTEPVDELRARTQLDVELALASPSRIRELIREVYARGTAAEEEGPGRPIELSGALDAALEAGAPAFGVSERGSRAWVWWDDAGTIRRRPIAGDWLGELERVLDPGAGRATTGQSRARWTARLSRAGTTTPVEVLFLSDESGSEYVLRPSRREGSGQRRFPLPPSGVVSEVRLLARSGKARFVVSADPVEVGHELLPHLPDLLFDPGWRSIHLHADDRGGETEVFSRKLPADPHEWPAELEALRAFRLWRRSISS